MNKEESASALKKGNKRKFAKEDEVVIQAKHQRDQITNFPSFEKESS